MVQAPKGTIDWLPPEGGRLDALESAFAAFARRFGYRRVFTPVFEHTEVFLRLGEATDIVKKEMYTFEDKGGKMLTLRPEGTAGVVRAFVEHGIGRREPLPWKVFYAGPAFRRENPQKGRYREHCHLGVEALGDDSPQLDVEVVDLLMSFLTSVGAGPLDLLVNSMGDGACRPEFVVEFRAYLETRLDELCDECRERVRTNPLRTLDCKSPTCRSVTDAAPKLVDHLCSPCRAHFDSVCEGVEDLGWRSRLEPRLVRGQDYYTRTTFEVQTAALESAQNALGGGGRYDGLVEDLGGDPTPAVGFGFGAERVLLVTAEVDGEAPLTAAVVDVTEGGRSGTRILAALRRAGIASDAAGRGRSLKAQLRACERLGARVAVIVGPDEVARGVVQVKNVTTGEQREIAIDSLAASLS